MQFNPIFFPSNSVSKSSFRKDVKAFNNLKYLFSDLVKVSIDDSPGPTIFSKILHKSKPNTSQTPVENKIELDIDKPAENELFSKLANDSSPSLIAILNSLYNSIDPFSKPSANPGDVHNDQNKIAEFEIKGVDKEMLKEFLMDLKFNLNENFLSSSTSGMKSYFDQNKIIKDIPNIENRKLTYLSIEDIIKQIENNSKVEFELNKNSTYEKVINSAANIDQKNEGGFNFLTELMNDKVAGSKDFPVINDVLEKLDLTSVDKEIKFRYNNKADEIVNNINKSPKKNSADNSGELTDENKHIVNSIKRIKIEITKNRLSPGQLLSGISGKSHARNKQYSVIMKIANQPVADGKNNSSQHLFVTNNSIQNYLRSNENLRELKTKLSNVFKNAEQINVADKTIPNKVVPELSELNTNEIVITRQGENIDKKNPAIKEKVMVFDVKKNQPETEINTGLNNDSPEQQKTDKNLPVAENQTKSSPGDAAKTPRKIFNDPQINLVDKNSLNILGQTKLGNKISQQKLLNSSEVINKVSEIIQKREKKSIEIKLNPPELGKMKVRVDYGQKKIYVRMEVENEAAKQLISQNLEQLKQTINQSGMQLKEIFVSLAGSEQRKQKSSATRKRETEIKTKSIFESPNTEMTVKMMGYNTYDYLI